MSSLLLAREYSLVSYCTTLALWDGPSPALPGGRPQGHCGLLQVSLIECHPHNSEHRLTLI